jgi:hypothetical protein
VHVGSDHGRRRHDPSPLLGSETWWLRAVAHVAEPGPNPGEFCQPTVRTRMSGSDHEEYDMRHAIWAVLSAALMVSTANAQSAPTPGPPITLDSTPKPIVIDPPPNFSQPCSFVPAGSSPECPAPPPARLCMVGGQRCSDLAKPSGKMVPL